MFFVCKYLGLLEPIRHLIVDLSRKKHVKVLILFVTIEIGAFLYLQLSLLIFCKSECILFPYRHLQQRPGEWRTNFLLFFLFSFALKHFSTAILLCLWAKRLNTLTYKCPLTSSLEIECNDIETGFFTFVCFPWVIFQKQSSGGVL